MTWDLPIILCQNGNEFGQYTSTTQNASEWSTRRIPNNREKCFVQVISVFICPFFSLIAWVLGKPSSSKSLAIPNVVNLSDLSGQVTIIIENQSNMIANQTLIIQELQSSNELLQQLVKIAKKWAIRKSLVFCRTMNVKWKYFFMKRTEERNRITVFEKLFFFFNFVSFPSRDVRWSIFHCRRGVAWKYFWIRRQRKFYL